MADVASRLRNAEPALLTVELSERTAWFDLQELWRYRELVLFLVWRDLTVRYRQTALGVAWALLQPLLTMAVMTMLFGRLAKTPTHGVPYPLFVLVGLTPWFFFAHGVSAATSSIVNNQDLVRRVYFPRMAIPLGAVLSGGAELLISLVLLVGALSIYGWSPTPIALLAAPFLVSGVVATIGTGLMLCAANVVYRDVGHAVPFALQIALFASPIAYASTTLPERWRLLYSLNPMVGVVDGLRWSLFGSPCEPLQLAVSVAMSVLVLAVGIAYFRRVERSLADVL